MNHELVDLEKFRFLPFYQPIVKLDDQNIFGYEALGRMIDNETGKVSSMGPLFHRLEGGGGTDTAFLIYIDSILQTKALEALGKAPSNAKIFLNVMPRTLSGIGPGRASHHIVRKMEELGLPPERIVIEITEDEFKGELSQLVEIIEEFKAAGLLIAVDDVGSGNSDLNRIALIRPDIIKVDLQLLRKSLTHPAFRQILQTVSAMAHRLGSSLLFEGIEREEELFMALRMGARYLQGFLFSQAEQEFQDPTLYAGLLKTCMKEHSSFLMAEYIQGFQIRDNLVSTMRTAASSVSLNGNISDSLKQALPEFPNHMSKIALFSSDGSQLTPEFAIEKGGWVQKDEGINQNASWRPYFLQVLAMQQYASQDWILSEPHYNLTSEFPRVTLFMALGESRVLVAELDWMG